MRVREAVREIDRGGERGRGVRMERESAVHSECKGKDSKILAERKRW